MAFAFDRPVPQSQSWNHALRDWGEVACPNEASSDAHDAISKQPSLKCCALAVSSADVADEAEPPAAIEIKPATRGEPAVVG